jgi:putative endonuclease
VPLVARAIYAAMIWQERRRARRPATHEPGVTQAPHLATGKRGESLAYWYLRRQGYTIVARNLRLHPGRGELDLVGWDGPVLAFVEVKTRSSDEAGPPEAAVTLDQQKRIIAASQSYLRGLKHGPHNYRFDIVSVARDAAEGYRLRLIKGAFK